MKYYSRNASTSAVRLLLKKWSQKAPELYYCVLPIEIEKIGYVLVGFNYYREVHSNTVLEAFGTTFFVILRRRNPRVSRVILENTSGFVLRPGHEVYSRD